MIATLDDSCANHDGIFVYSHALIIDEHPEILLFSGGNVEIYTHESEIYDWLANILSPDDELYACNHYARYESIWDLVFQEVNGVRLPKGISKAFTQAHHTAKNAAKQELERILSGIKT